MNILPIRNGITREELHSTMRAVAQATENARGREGPGQSLLERVELYVDWAGEAQRQLHNVLDSDFAAELTQTDVYWKIRSLSVDAARLNTLIRLEYDARIRRFEEILTQLAQEKRRWEAFFAPLLVPDTNILANPAMAIDAVHWADLISARSDVRVVVPLAVVYELDGLKTKGNQDAAAAARAAIRWLHEHLPTDPVDRSGPLGCGTPDATVEVYIDGTTGVLPDVDGQIIDFCIWLKAVAHLPVHLVTRDKNVDLRARTAAVDNVMFIPPSEEEVSRRAKRRSRATNDSE